jgi:hypothetical protein
LMRERGNKSLLTERDWKAMYEAQERDLAALRKELEGLRQESRIAELEAERDAERAGEARAVEALRKLSISARLAANYADDLKHSDDAWTEIAVLIGEVRGIRKVLDSSQPALDWLAQREREAVVRELEQLMESEWKWEEFELKASIHARLADLRTQQPTACPRSEVRGVGES